MRLRVTCSCILLLSIFLMPVSAFDLSDATATEKAVASTVYRFFTDWLVQRNTQAATGYIAASPILGTCMMPEADRKKPMIARDKVVDLLNQVFANALEAIPKQQQLSEIIMSPEMVSANDGNIVLIDHSMKALFQLFRLKDGKKTENIRYICKFDERKSFRVKVARANTYYVITEIKVEGKQRGVKLETIWVKEKKNWRLLTMAVAED